MNLTKLTYVQCAKLLDLTVSEVDNIARLAGTRIVGSEVGTINLPKLLVWFVDGQPRPEGRLRQYTAEEKKQKKRDADLARVNAATRATNELGEIPFDTINWERRVACRDDQLLFEKTYLPMICEKPNAPYHYTLVQSIMETIKHGGKQAILLPRGGAKTTKCRAGLLHGGLFGRIRWGYNIAANEDKALETIETIKTWLKNSPILLNDFPEICYPISRIKSALPGSVPESQTYNGVRTGMVWARDEIRFPCIKLPDEIAEIYREFDPQSVRFVSLDPSNPSNGFWMPTSAGMILTSIGINSSIRGGNIAHPLTMEQVRPNFAILDDVQNDAGASSVITVQKLDKVISNAVRFLPKPGEPIAMLMPCTVIESGDLADTYGDPEKKPEWRGIRVPMVKHWPEGMDNKSITQETETSRLWTKYADIRRVSMRKYGDIRDATNFYRQNQDLMDDGFEVSWTERYEPGEISAIQNAMNLRFEDHRAFLTNMQQVGADILDGEARRVPWRQFAEKTLPIKHGSVPGNAQKLVCYVDIQAEYFAYVVLAVNYDFSCCFVADYGTFPDFSVRHYRRRQANDWKMLTKGYLSSTNQTFSRTQINADVVYTWGLRMLLDNLLAKKWTREDGDNSIIKINHIALDAQEGIVSPIVRKICNEYPTEMTIACHGFGIQAGRMGMETYKATAGTVYEDMRNPTVNARRWVYKYSQVSHRFELHSDTNAWKDFLFERLRTPIGSSGSLSLFEEYPQYHELFAMQVCESEKPEEFTSRGITRNQWIALPGIDNEYLDCLTGCCMLASFAGCVFVPTHGTNISTIRQIKKAKTYKEQLEERKNRRRK